MYIHICTYLYKDLHIRYTMLYYVIVDVTECCTTLNPPLYPSRHSRNKASDQKCDTFSNGPFPNGPNGHRLKEICCLGVLRVGFSGHLPPPSSKWAGIAKELPGWPLGLCSRSHRHKSQLNSDFSSICIALDLEN